MPVLGCRAQRLDRVDTQPEMPVDLGVASGGQIEVLPSAAAKGAALKPGDQVVVLGNERLRPEQPVIVTKVLTRESAAKTEKSRE